KDFAGLEGADLAGRVTSAENYAWSQGRWHWPEGFSEETARHHVVALDFGIKKNILRCLASVGCRVTVVPATTAASDIMALKPNGIFLSNGPGDPAATGAYAVAQISALVESGLPIFGICLGHQMLALALGAQTQKMKQGHHGANHPVKDVETGKVEITSMNHGFTVDRETLPYTVAETHVSLFDGTNCGIRLKDRPVFSVQYHPEASPGPQDSHYLFDRFTAAMEQ
ncbi:MAG: carbamoyl phosphate synthase small subunit, partial [Pseudomonadota bacterium]|nr:carbamoyl phosphate synthase small subunit [Pseudomonadota bacterium]